jgi:threonine/homoserine/homoserine lactone efflux protein
VGSCTAAFRVAPPHLFPETDTAVAGGPVDLLLAFLLKGIVVGVVIAVPVGPVGVMCVRRTIFEGRLAGLVSGLGAATTDAVFGIIAGFGLTVVSDWLIDYQQWLRDAGGCYLLCIGGWAFAAEPPAEVESERDPESLLADFVSTFVLAVTNPITVLAFLGIFTAIGLSGTQATFGRASILVLGVWCGSLLWWLMLSFGVGGVRHSIEPRHLGWISRGSGAILFFSGAALLATLIIDYLR